MNLPPHEAHSARVEDFLEPTPETLDALGTALQDLQSFAEKRDMTIGGMDGFVISGLDTTFANGAVVHGSWVDGTESKSVASLPPEFPVTFVNLDVGDRQLRYTLCANGASLLSIFRSHVPVLPGTANKSPTESGVLELTGAISNAVASGLPKDKQED